jgi:hypothetical protein
MSPFYNINNNIFFKWGGGTAVPPLPWGELAVPPLPPMLMVYKDPMLIEIECQYWQLLEIGIFIQFSSSLPDYCKIIY